MIRNELQTALKDAMRARDERALSTVRLILAALKDRDIAARGTGNSDGISDEEIRGMLGKMIKQRQESASMYEQGGRPELAQQEVDEAAVIKRFLPAELDEAQTAAAVAQVIDELEAGSIKDMGRVMTELRRRHAGAMDFARASEFAKGRLCG